MHLKHGYILAGIAAVVLLVVHALNSSWPIEAVIRQSLESRPGITVRRVHVARHGFSLPGRLELQQVDLMLDVHGKSLTVQVPQVDVTGLQSFWSDDRRILIAAGSITARYDLGYAKELRAELAVDRRGASGPLTAVEAGWDKLRARDVSLFLVVNAAGVEMRALKVAAYGGQITGKVFVDASPGEKAGTYQAELFIEGLDLVRLGEFNPDIPSQLNGIVRGTLKFEGGPKGLRTLDIDLAMPAGGRISASLLSALTQYLPPSQEKKRLDLVVRQGGKIAMEAFSFIMKGGDEGKFSGEVRLRSREVNLELNLAHDINTDGTAASLFEYWDRLF